MPDTKKKLKSLKDLLDGLKIAGLRHKHVDYEWIEDCVASLFEHASLKEGDRVKLVKEPDFEKAPGWKHCSHFLVVGAEGTVKSVEFWKGKFRYYVEFDDESWLKETEYNKELKRIVTLDPPEVVLMEPDQRHVFGFCRKNDPLLEKINE